MASYIPHPFSPPRPVTLEYAPCELSTSLMWPHSHALTATRTRPLSSRACWHSQPMASRICFSSFTRTRGHTHSSPLLAPEFVATLTLSLWLHAPVPFDISSSWSDTHTPLVDRTPRPALDLHGLATHWSTSPISIRGKNWPMWTTLSLTFVQGLAIQPHHPSLL
jgi:hypothetical protein